MTLKITILKREQELKVKKLWKQVEDQKYGKKLSVVAIYRMKVNSKAFAIPILTAMIPNIIKADVVRIGIANTSQSTFVLYGNH